MIAPGTLFTLAAFLLLVAAIVVHPDGAVSNTHRKSVLYLMAALVGSIYIWFSAIQGIRERDFTADIPVSFATIAAIAVGYYSAAAVVAVLLLAGGLLEEFVSARADRALDALASLLPDQITIRRDGVEAQIAIQDVRRDDVVLVRPGERIPVDGEVIGGSASVNQAAITGESVPVDKQQGDGVFAGTLASLGALEVRATKVGVETTLGQIRRMVAEAQQQKAPIERVLDRYAKLYTPVALVLAAGLWLITGEASRAITMLIVFCPCVMVLATPTALVASIGNAALRGSLVKKGATIEAMEKIDTVCFDKTGTLTHGEPRLLRTIALNGLADTELLRLAASAEKFSEHALAQAIVDAAGSRMIAVPDPDHFDALPGLGIRASTCGQNVIVGRPDLLAGQGVQVADELRSQIVELTGPGATVIAIAVDDQAAGLLVMRDTLRPDAKAVVSALNQLGTTTVLVTGDNNATAQRIAAELGIVEVHAEVLPARKAQIVKHLQAQGRRVAFVGDGVNDGPALAVAHVGIAMGAGGTDLAIETADVTLLADELSRLPHLLSLSRAALKAIRQNLAFSLGVLGIAVGLTIPGVLTPISGALLHELSSIPVIANSARLISRKAK
ncbi:MAG: cation-translocating P-type ATPase [Actinomycetota bacterium]|nr:cation-translocating P-type ATPase [Actinomycetota bacterium]